MILAYLIFGHLLADFVFQPTALVEWKMKSMKGTILHSLIHFIIVSVVLLPFILNENVWLIGVAFGLAFTHFWIDEAKISYNIMHDEKVKPFIIDQLLHLLAILVIFLLIFDKNLSLPASGFNNLYTNLPLILFFSFLIFASAAMEIYGYQKKKEKNKKASLKISTKNMLKRIFVLSLTYLLFMLFVFYAFGKSA